MLDRIWYHRTLLTWLLWPLSCVFRCIAFYRRKRFLTGKQKSYRPEQPVIIVGNIGVGGNGKTPVVLAICRYLSQIGYHPGVISRGYGGKAGSPLLVTETMSASLCGDEPLLIFRRSLCPVAVFADRQQAIEQLLQHHPECDVIIADDGMQHYRLARDVEICVVDAVRQFGNGFCLPAGPLREPVRRLDDVDRIVSNGGLLDGFSADVMLLEPGSWFLVQNREQVSHESVPQKGWALAGIGHPQRFYQTLSEQDIEIEGYVDVPDHAILNSGQINRLQDQVVFMTEKDALKYSQLAGPKWYYLSVSAALPDAFYSFISQRVELFYASRS
ncbi:MAG: Tetraacyldisaccharide 4'-kinase [Candidatus Celerinatantimonas neptuna]|nr:MAG: Tetraacyldisaccharide 4'-kinase [Candidatus Celerinatantimonas neptuna]